MVPIDIFKKVVREITEGNLDARVNVGNKKDEVAEFATDFNKMAEELKDSIQNIEKTVEERTKKLEQSETTLKKTLDDSERLNKLMIGRELTMVDLKKEIAELKSKK